MEIIGADKMAYCKSCHKLVVRGVYCDNCDTVAWHLYCLEKVASGGKDVKCRDCNSLVKKGAGRARNGARNGGSPRAEPSQRHERRGEPRKRSRRSSAREESEEEEMSQSQVVKSSGSRIKRGFSGDSDSDSD